jgi:hypothetical protein
LQQFTRFREASRAGPAVRGQYGIAAKCVLRNPWGRYVTRQTAVADQEIPPARDIIGAPLTMYVVNVLEHHGEVVVTAHVDGNYAKRGLPDPLVLAFHFSARGDEIVQLIVLRNQADT